MLGAIEMHYTQPRLASGGITDEVSDALFTDYDDNHDLNAVALFKEHLLSEIAATRHGASRSYVVDENIVMCGDWTSSSFSSPLEIFSSKTARSTSPSPLGASGASVRTEKRQKRNDRSTSGGHHVLMSRREPPIIPTKKNSSTTNKQSQDTNTAYVIPSGSNSRFEKKLRALRNSGAGGNNGGVSAAANKKKSPPATAFADVKKQEIKTKTASHNPMMQQPSPTICLIPGLDQTDMLASIPNHPKDIIEAASSVALSSSATAPGGSSSSASVSSTGSGSSSFTNNTKKINSTGSGGVPKDIKATLDDSARRVYNKDGTKIRPTKTVISLDGDATRRVYNKDGTKIRTPTKTVTDVLGRKEIELKEF